MGGRAGANACDAFQASRASSPAPPAPAPAHPCPPPPHTHTHHRLQVKLQGIEGIRKVFLREAKCTRLDPNGSGFVTDNEWVLDTEGEPGGASGVGGGGPCARG